MLCVVQLDGIEYINRSVKFPSFVACLFKGCEFRRMYVYFGTLAYQLSYRAQSALASSEGEFILGRFQQC